MLKLEFTFTNVHESLITVQDNTMLKPSLYQAITSLCLITVQDNTMLKL